MRRSVVVAVLIVALASVTLLTLAFTGVLGWAMDRLFASDQIQHHQNVNLDEPKAADIDEALKLIHTARDKFAGVEDYHCTYLRDEHIDGELKQNHLHLKVRHEPFSVHMEWVAPQSKKGRRAAYVKGQNGDKMVVKDFLTIRMDPEQSVKMKESRHTILEAGLKGMIDRFCTRWQREKELGWTTVLSQEGEVKVVLAGKEVTRPCTCVTTIHNPKHKDEFVREGFLFYRTLLYFDKETGLPMRMEGYDWPKSPGEKETLLLERYTYIEVKSNVELKDHDFKW